MRHHLERHRSDELPCEGERLVDGRLAQLDGRERHRLRGLKRALQLSGVVRCSCPADGGRRLAGDWQEIGRRLAGDWQEIGHAEQGAVRWSYGGPQPQQASSRKSRLQHVARIGQLAARSLQ